MKNPSLHFVWSFFCFFFFSLLNKVVMLQNNFIKNQKVKFNNMLNKQHGFKARSPGLDCGQ